MLPLVEAELIFPLGCCCVFSVVIFWGRCLKMASIMSLKETFLGMKLKKYFELMHLQTVLQSPLICCTR